MDHISHLPDGDLPSDTFHLVNPEPMTVGETLNEFAKAAHAPQFAMRVDPNLTNAVPKQVRAGLKALPMVKRIRNQLYHDIGVPPAAMENRDFHAKFDARDTQRALSGTGIAVPPLSTYAPRLWDYWERNLDPDLFRDRSLASLVKDKRVLITGASSGIGLETALKVGEAGGIVLLVSRTREKLEEVAKQVEELGGMAHVHPADLSDLEDIDRLAAEVLEQHGGVDVLVNNAGRSIRRSVERSYDRFHDYERTMQLNYFGALKLILAFMPGMRERKSGHIINVSSIGVQTNTPRFSAYVASKSALDAFSRCTAPEVVADNVKFTTVYMPLVRTPMIAPTDIYKAFPTLTPDEAAQMLCDAMIDKPKRMASRLGTFGEILYSISPKSVDIVLNQAYNLFPDSTAAKKKDGDRTRARRSRCQPVRRRTTARCPRRRWPWPTCSVACTSSGAGARGRRWRASSRPLPRGAGARARAVSDNVDRHRLGAVAHAARALRRARAALRRAGVLPCPAVLAQHPDRAPALALCRCSWIVTRAGSDSRYLIVEPRTPSPLITGRIESTLSGAPATAEAPCGSLTRTRGVSVVVPLYPCVIVGFVPPSVSKLPLPSRSQA